MSEITTNKAVIEHELIAIYEDKGQLVPAEVVEAAKAGAHPLHRFFEWDDTVAGPAYRNLQATQMIRSVTIKVTTETGEDVIDRKVRGWVPARYVGESRPGYIPAAAVQTAEQRDLLRRQIKRQITSLRNQYGHTEEFWKALDEIRRPALAGRQDPAEAPPGQ